MTEPPKSDTRQRDFENPVEFDTLGEEVLDETIFLPDDFREQVRQEKERKDTPGSLTPGEEIELNDKASSTETTLFDFSKVAGKQLQKPLKLTSTFAFQESFMALAEMLDFEDHRELFRRAIFAAAEDPSMLRTPNV